MPRQEACLVFFTVTGKRRRKMKPFPTTLYTTTVCFLKVGLSPRASYSISVFSRPVPSGLFDRATHARTTYQCTPSAASLLQLLFLVCVSRLRQPDITILRVQYVNLLPFCTTDTRCPNLKRIAGTSKHPNRIFV